MVDHVANYSWDVDQHVYDPAHFWGWVVPYNVAIDGCFIALFLVRGRRATIALLAVQILVFLVPYWNAGAIDRLSMRRCNRLIPSSSAQLRPLGLRVAVPSD